MKQEEILEYNKRCLSFLGRELSEISYIEESTNIEYYRDQTFEDLEFHSDWNCIMEVVEAIENLPNGRWFVHVSTGESYPVVRIEDGNEIPQFDVMVNVNNCVGYGEHLHLTKKEAVVKAINQFLILYKDYGIK